jgi:CPA2 family monovalent cation:H+ antiporter-2
MLLEPVFVWQNFWAIALVVSMILFGKMVITGFVVLLFRHSFRTALLVAFSLSQIGEFSFVLVRMGMENKLVGEFFYQITLASAIATMILTPALIQAGHLLCDLLVRKKWMEGVFETEADSRLQEAGKRLANHVLLCGYGPIGRNLAKSLSACGVPFIALELNPATVHELTAASAPVYYGDASSATILKMAGVERAAAVAVTIPDPVASRMIVRQVRKLNPQARIIARAKFIRDKEDLIALGAHEVIHEEFEASLEVIFRALRQLGVPEETINRTVQDMRGHSKGDSP